MATFPPALLALLTEEKMQSLKTIVIAGESCKQDIMNTWSKGRRFINAYGPTENTVCAAMHAYQEGDLSTNIGKPNE